MTKFINLGVIKNSVKRDLREIDEIFERLTAAVCLGQCNQGRDS